MEVVATTAAEVSPAPILPNNPLNEFLLIRSYIELSFPGVRMNRIKLRTIKTRKMRLGSGNPVIDKYLKYAQEENLSKNVCAGQTTLALKFFQPLPFDPTELIVRGSHVNGQFHYHLIIKRHEEILFEKKSIQDTPFGAPYVRLKTMSTTFNDQGTRYASKTISIDDFLNVPIPSEVVISGKGFSIFDDLGELHSIRSTYRQRPFPLALNPKQSALIELYSNGHGIDKQIQGTVLEMRFNTLCYHWLSIIVIFTHELATKMSPLLASSNLARIREEVNFAFLEENIDYILFVSDELLLPQLSTTEEDARVPEESEEINWQAMSIDVIWPYFKRRLASILARLRKVKSSEKRIEDWKEALEPLSYHSANLISTFAEKLESEAFSLKPYFNTATQMVKEISEAHNIPAIIDQSFSINDRLQEDCKRSQTPIYYWRSINPRSLTFLVETVVLSIIRDKGGFFSNNFYLHKYVKLDPHHLQLSIAAASKQKNRKLHVRLPNLKNQPKREIKVVNQTVKCKFSNWSNSKLDPFADKIHWKEVAKLPNTIGMVYAHYLIAVENYNSQKHTREIFVVNFRPQSGQTKDEAPRPDTFTSKVQQVEEMVEDKPKEPENTESPAKVSQLTNITTPPDDVNPSLASISPIGDDTLQPQIVPKELSEVCKTSTIVLGEKTQITAIAANKYQILVIFKKSSEYYFSVYEENKEDRTFELISTYPMEKLDIKLSEDAKQKKENPPRLEVNQENGEINEEMEDEEEEDDGIPGFGCQWNLYSTEDHALLIKSRYQFDKSEFTQDIICVRLTSRMYKEPSSSSLNVKISPPTIGAKNSQLMLQQCIATFFSYKGVSFYVCCSVFSPGYLIIAARRDQPIALVSNSFNLNYLNPPCRGLSYLLSINSAKQPKEHIIEEEDYDLPHTLIFPHWNPLKKRIGFLVLNTKQDYSLQSGVTSIHSVTTRVLT